MELKTLGRYKILGELGRGAMGAVYRALDPVIEREVAIKTLLPNLPTEVIDEVRERFIREARSAGRLSHPSIVTIFDVGEQDGVAYIAMELLKGHSLLQVLKHPQRLAFNTIANLIAQVAEALDVAQQHGIVHRDVKPANIMVDNAGRVKLTDFGVAYVPASTITGNGTALGSPRYMSPEQVTGAPIDARSDIFSLGVVLYELLTKRTPFEHEGDTTIFALMNRIASTPHPPLRSVDGSIPAPFEHIVDRALAKQPAERYQRAGEMARELRDYRNLQPRPAPARLALAGEPASHVAGRSSGVHVDPVRTQLIHDLDKFVEQYDREEQGRIREADAEQRRKEEQMRRWGEEQAREREAFERARSGPAAHAPEVALAAPGRSPAELNAAMRSAIQHVGALVQTINASRPIAKRPYEFIYLGKLEKVSVAEAAAEARPRTVEGQTVTEHLHLRFRITPSQPAKAIVSGEDIERCEQYLRLLKVGFTQRVLAKSEPGKPARTEVSVTGSLPCEIAIKADYAANKVAVELTNVRRLGRVAYQLGPRAFAEALEGLARYVLGADDDFEALARAGR